MTPIHNEEQRKNLHELFGCLRSFDEIFLASCKDHGLSERDAMRELLSCDERQELIKNIGIVTRVEIMPAISVTDSEFDSMVML